MLKKIIYGLGILFLVIIIVLNIVFTADLDTSEHITIHFNSIHYVLGVIVIGGLIYFITKIIDKYLYHSTKEKSKKEIRTLLFMNALAIYAASSILWSILINPRVIGDSVHVCNLAQTFYRGDTEEFLPNMTYIGIPLIQYIQAYPQQISLAFVYHLFFHIIRFDIMEVLRIINIMANVGIVIAIYKISQQLSKKYETNKVLPLLLILTFLSLPMLSTFIYGDIPSLALCLFSIYFIMRYTETKKNRYFLFSSIFSMFAYMMRMNSLIFIIATVIYLLFNLEKEFKQKLWKKTTCRLLVIILYIVIAILPATLVKNYYFKKYELDKNKTYPSVSFLLMGMEESPRGNGWYNEEIAIPVLKNPENSKTEYLEKIKTRLSYFSQNLEETFQFYLMKISSMWTENTYSAVRNNSVKNYNLEWLIKPLTFYQKVLLILIGLCSFIILFQNRKNISLELLLLITVFVGGFLFHVLWEAKSRYIIPYIVILIPVVSIKVKQSNLKYNL